MNQPTERTRKIYRATWIGMVVNIALSLLKLAAGILGRSGAMIADAVHSISDLATDVIVLIFARISSKPEDAGHNYGHGKYETLASILISLTLIAVGGGILADSIRNIRLVLTGEIIGRPGAIALIAAAISIVAKEVLYRYTVRDKWRIADPLAALVVSVFIFKIAFDLLRSGLGELLEHALPAATEQEILNILTHSKEVTEPHHLRTRRIGATVAIEAHIRVDPRMSVLRSHQLTVDIERQLKERFGPNTLISIHVEPIETEKLSSSDSEKDKNI